MCSIQRNSNSKAAVRVCMCMCVHMKKIHTKNTPRRWNNTEAVRAAQVFILFERLCVSVVISSSRKEYQKKKFI